jgi:hypothetical protein
MNAIMKPYFFIVGLLAVCLTASAELTRIPGETLVKPVFDSSDLVCFGYVEEVAITRASATNDSYGNIFFPDTMRADLRVVDLFKGHLATPGKVVVQDLHKTTVSMQPLSVLQKGKTYILFLKADSSGIYGLSDPYIGAVRLTKIGKPTTGTGLARLESALTSTILSSDRDDRVTALRLLQGYESLNQNTMFAIDALCDSPDPDVAFTALAIVVKTKTP